MPERIPSDAEEIINAINQQTTVQEIQLAELNDHVNDVKNYLGMISTHLNTIAKIQARNS
jgi:hypothetical protein|tara:strand:+ start:407 stop:586 length:180 start_codon:yes stop_codon:yes gene_type:complete